MRVKDDMYRPKYAEPPKLDEAGLIAYLKTQQDVAAAYLFGSMATGKATAQSDVDVAILLIGASSDPLLLFDRQMQLEAGLRQFVDREFDLVVLNRTSLILCQEILSTGRVLYEGDRLARVMFQVKVGREYADMKPVYEFFTQAVFDAAREGRLGKPRSRHLRATQGSAR